LLDDCVTGGTITDFFPNIAPDPGSRAKYSRLKDRRQRELVSASPQQRVVDAISRFAASLPKRLRRNMIVNYPACGGSWGHLKRKALKERARGAE
jgi:hypothetical protein